MMAAQVACSNTDFGGKAEKRAAANDGDIPTADALKSTGGGYPEAPSLDAPGWIGDQARNDFVDLFNKGRKPGSGSDGVGPKTSKDGPGSSGGEGDGSDQSPGEKLFNNVDGVLWLPCDLKANGGGGVFPSQFYGKADNMVRLSGEWCPKVSGKSEATVLFIVDRSGSMTGGGGEGPNDPSQGGSCGRLKAVEKIVEKLNNAKNTKVRSGVVTFSNAAETRIPVGPLSAVEQSLAPGVFCGADIGVAKTNYQAAFKAAENQLKNEKGSKIVIFISDGSPTLYDGLSPTGLITANDRQISEARGLEAAESLRVIDGISFFTLFLGYKGSGTDVASDPKGYLEKVTGDPNNVRLTKDADELVEAAANLGLPLDQIQIQEPKGLLVNLKGEKNVAIEKVERHPTDSERFIWYTEPFNFAGTLNQGELNTLTVTAKSSSGDNLKTTSKVTFYLQN
jgi:hypothetical protein